MLSYEFGSHTQQSAFTNRVQFCEEWPLLTGQAKNIDASHSKISIHACLGEVANKMIESRHFKVPLGNHVIIPTLQKHTNQQGMAPVNWLQQMFQI